MKKLNLLAISAAVSGALLSGAAAAEVTANVGAASNYLWRGVSLSGESSQVYGGVDYSHAAGLYAGVWQSSEGATASGETDVYVGFAGEAGKIAYDVGFIQYMYPQDATPDIDYGEVYFSVGYDFAEFFYANSSDLKLGTGEGSDYMSLTLSYDKFWFTYGDYGFDDSTNDYSHFDLGVSLTDELSLTYSQNDITGDDDGRLVVAYTLEFDVK